MQDNLSDIQKLNITNLCKEILNEHKLSNGVSAFEMCSKIVISDKVLKIILEVELSRVGEYKKIEPNLLQVLKYKISSTFPVIEDVIILTSSQKKEDIKQKKILPKEQKSHPNIKKIILVSSGKGGVGKSTVASYLACSLSANHSVGLLDLDLNGPSIPYLFSINDSAEIIDGKIIPKKTMGLSIMSMGFLVNEEKAIMWRGPMHGKTIHQFMYSVDWPMLDYLIIDMPPGTADTHITMLENYNISSVLFVANEQPLALKDLAKAIDLYNKFNITSSGLILNMCDIFENKKHKILCDEWSVLLNKFRKSHSLDLIGKIKYEPEFSLPISEQKIKLFAKNIDIHKLT